ncbi:EsV-1-7 [Ectocarpus siliculosus]|uniref:EsV-1-7 n=1 Tax=Ectocarpus siliculosus TaxID=2880 RepID=D7FKH1_ECTSI|nr:EsV-1-7 [Ectocarpus siliculosus]|eukprot:CBJ29373.1 EsV-1-7 [Ectocarpus siliculosus]
MHDSHRRCEHSGCTKWPLYAFEGEKAKYCSQHKDEGMVDVRSRRCQEPSCTRQPSFGFEHQKPRFCAAHKDVGMVDVVSRRCEETDCRRRPLYGHEGEKGRFCSYHKSDGMVDVVNKRCQHPGCKKRPVFGFEGEKGRFCSLHRSGGMVDVVSRRCDSPGCKRQPSGTTDSTHVQFCSLHRGDGGAGYTLLMLAQRERLAAAAALEEQQKQQRARARDRAPASGSWPGKDMPYSDYRPRWEAAGSSGSSGGTSFSGGQPAPGGRTGTFGSNSSSSGSFLSSQRSGGGGGDSGSFTGESFLSTQRRGTDEGPAGGEPGSAGQDGKAAAHNPQPWVWTAQPRGSSQGARRPPPLKNPAEAGVLGIAGRQQSPLLDSTRGDSPGAEWTKPSSTQSAHAMYPAVKRHCSPRRRSFSHSPEPGSRTMAGLTGSMAGLQASSPASPNIMSLGASGGTPSPGAMGIPTPPGSSGSAALPPPHRARRSTAQRLPQPQFQNRAVPRSSSGGPPRPPRSLSPGGVASTARSPDGFVYALSGAGGSVADTLEDLSIVDPIPPTLEPLRTLPPVAAPLRSPRDRWRAGFLERRNNSEIILPLPDRTQPDPAPGPASDVRRRSFTASLFERQDQMNIKDEGVARPGERGGGGPGGPGSGDGGGGGGSANGAMIAAGAGEGDRWGAGMWSSPGEGVFQATSAGARQQGWPHQMQNGRTGDEGGGGGGHAEAKATRRGSHHSVGTMPLTSSESLGDGDGGSVFFSAEG